MRLRLLRAVLLVLRLQGSQACPQFCGAHAGQVSHQNPYGGLAGVPIKAISEVLGHATSAFTADVYTEVAEELADAAAAAIAAYIPRKRRSSGEVDRG